MNTEPNPITRRDALLGTLKGAVVAALATPFLAAAEMPPSMPEQQFVPENDYPFFGYEPESFE